MVLNQRNIGIMDDSSPLVEQQNGWFLQVYFKPEQRTQKSAERHNWNAEGFDLNQIISIILPIKNQHAAGVARVV